MKAYWNQIVIAESENTIVIEGNHYFPIESLKMEFFEKSQAHSECSWKGTASYYSLSVLDKKNIDAAWYYKSPKPAAKRILNHVAFWKGVEIQ
jgi:uncharacterized protein (DUF427 family)